MTDCLQSEWVSSSGPYVQRFEQSIAAFVGKDAAVATVNGTAALHISLILAGVHPGDEVIVPTLTFIAPINAVHYAGAEPVFMDCDDYLNMDVGKLSQFCEQECEIRENALYNRTSGKRIRAVIPVHVFGAICCMDELMDIAKQYHLVVVEDATEALGSVMCAGRCAGLHAGTMGNFGCYSFNGNKIMTSGGGGMMIAKDATVLDHARYLTTQAKDNGLFYIHNDIGYNYRLPAISAAMGVAQAEQLPEFIAAKRMLYGKYRGAIDGIPGLSMVGMPDYCESNCWFYSLVVDEQQFGMSRDQLMDRFEKANIQTRPIWKLNHTQRPYQHCQAFSIEKAQWYQDRVLNIPCSVELTEPEFERVMAVLNQGIFE